MNLDETLKSKVKVNAHDSSQVTKYISLFY
jgi:hypothetical protein